MLIDLHVHTAEVSVCAALSAADTVRIYKEKTSYNALVITDHMNGSFFYANKEQKSEDWQDTVTRHMKGYLAAKEEGDKCGIKVFYGCELRFDSEPNDYLVYGMSEEFLREHPHINKMKIRDFAPLAAENGILVYQAHPFRNDMLIIPPELLFGIEIGNGLNSRSRNNFAHLWADCYGLHKIAGSDCHRESLVGLAGIVAKREVESADDLVDVLRNDDYLTVENTGKAF